MNVATENLEYSKRPMLLLSLVSGCGLMLLTRLQLGLFGAVCVALLPPPQCALGNACRCWLLGALFACSCSCVIGPRCGPLLVLECANCGFLLLFALLHLFPLLLLSAIQSTARGAEDETFNNPKSDSFTQIAPQHQTHPEACRGGWRASIESAQAMQRSIPHSADTSRLQMPTHSCWVHVLSG